MRNPQATTGNPKLPNQILIADFDTSQNVFHVNQTGTELGVLQQKTTNVLANYLVSDLSKSVMPTARQGGSGPAPCWSQGLHASSQALLDSGGLADFRACYFWSIA